jgi:hypothetical protein
LAVVETPVTVVPQGVQAAAVVDLHLQRGLEHLAKATTVVQA